MELTTSTLSLLNFILEYRYWNRVFFKKNRDSHDFFYLNSMSRFIPDGDLIILDLEYTF